MPNDHIDTGGRMCSIFGGMDGWAVVDDRLDLISSHPPIVRIIHTTAMGFGTAVTDTDTDMGIDMDMNMGRFIGMDMNVRKAGGAAHQH